LTQIWARDGFIQAKAEELLPKEMIMAHIKEPRLINIWLLDGTNFMDDLPLN
jgi:hypothetical protein